MSGRPGVGGPKLRRLNMGYVFIILAIISFVITFFIFRGIMAGKSASADEKPSKTRELVVVTQHMYPGEILTEENLRTVAWPEDNYPSADVYEEAPKLVGRAVKTELMPGQPVYRLNLAGESSDGGMPVIIPKGYRAMTILVTENKGVGGFVKPGDRVDILGTFEVDVSEKVREDLGGVLPDDIHTSQTVLQDLQVLAIAQEMIEGRAPVDGGNNNAESSGEGAESKPTNADPAEAIKGKVVSSVTLAVTPEQAEVLAFADSRGDLRLSLRPESEHEQMELGGVVSNDIFPGLLDKLTGGASSFSGGGFRHNDEPEEELGDPGSPVEDMGGPMSFGGGNAIEIIEGTEKSSVSF